MTYIDEISGAMVRVLKHACDGDPHRFAGYAANADFWVAEAAHCLEVIDGYKLRFERLREATARYEGNSEKWVDYSPDTRTTRTSKFSDLSAARREIREVARRFLKRCEKLGLVSNDQVIEYAGKLSINLPL